MSTLGVISQELSIPLLETGSLTGAWSLPIRTGWLTCSKSWEPLVSASLAMDYKWTLLSLASVLGTELGPSLQSKHFSDYAPPPSPYCIPLHHKHNKLNHGV